MGGGTTIHDSVPHSTGSTCGASMSDGETCKVTCEDGYTATSGSWTCSAGSLVSFSMCYDSSDNTLNVEERTVVSAAMRMSFDLSGITMDEAKSVVGKAIAAALGVGGDFIIIEGITEAASRRLDGSSQRRLQGGSYDVKYQLIVPDGMSAADLLVKASDMATPGSDAFNAFTNTMAAENLP